MSNEPNDHVGSEMRMPGMARWLLIGLLFLLTAGGAVGAKMVADTQPGPVDPSPHDLHRITTQDALSFQGRLDRGAVHVGSDGLVHLELTATGASMPDRNVPRLPTDVVVVLDRSGSMGGDPMNKALAAIRELVGQLGRSDRFALVTYSNGADLTIPLAMATPDARRAWTSLLAGIGADGGTNMSAGFDRAHELVSNTRSAGRVARIILLSDGHANQGDASPDGLARRSGRAVSGEYVLSTVGVGQGFDERLMTQLADAGTGNFYYVPDVEVLAGIFESEFESARETVASALEVRIETPKGVHVVDAAGYPLDVHPTHVVIRPGSLFAGQERSFWVTLRVPAASAGEIALGNVRLAYSTTDGKRHEARLASFSTIAAVVDESQFVASLDADAVQTHHAEETVNRVRQAISALVSTGDYSGARDRLEAVDFEELEAVGLKAEDTESFVEIKMLKDEVDKAAAAPAAGQSEIRNKLGKALYESGTDGRRQGSKR